MLDIALLALLVAIAPAVLTWRGRTARSRGGPASTPRRLPTLALAVGLTGLLAVDWITQGRSPAALGLAFPPTRVGGIGLAIAATLLVGAAVAMTAQARAGKLPDVAPPFFPTRREDTPLFVAFLVVTSTSWELLYRGFLIWALTPRLGWAAAIAVAALAYALAHGFKDLKTNLRGLGAALAFTIAYAATGSLWWLIVIHVGLPLLGAYVMAKPRGLAALA